MFPIAKPPTDNLYKFMTVLGLSLLMVSTYAVYSNVFEYERAMSSLSFDVNLLGEDKAALKAEALSQEANTEQIGKQTARLSKTAADLRRSRTASERDIENVLAETSALQERLSQSKNIVEEIGTKDSDLRAKARELRRRLNSMDSERDHTFTILKLGALGQGAGIFLSYMGVFLWYRRVQRHLDRRLESSNALQVDEGSS